MKRIPVIPVVLSLGLAACDTMNTPVTGGNFDPLQTPGGGTSYQLANTDGFSAGEFVLAIMNNTAFFNQRPKGDADADKLLPRGTSMKVISQSESYVKVELDSGEIGWVPGVMIESVNAASSQNDAFGAPNPGEYQVYPPAGPYAGDFPALTPQGMPPDGTIPAIIDPEASNTSDPVPPVTVPGEEFAAPNENKPPTEEIAPAEGKTPPE